MILWLIPIVLFSAAAFTALGGSPTAAIVLALIGMASILVISRLGGRRGSGPPPELSPEQSAGLRAERERAGEVAAVRRLRKEHPGVSLIDAVRAVRRL